MTLKEKIEKLRTVFPDDERLRNAVLMAWGTTEQLPALNAAFGQVLTDLPPPGESTIQWETVVQLNLADVLRWVSGLELSLHDLRASLFFRYNNRVVKLKPMTEQEQAEAIEVAESEDQRNRNREAVKKAEAEEEQPENKREKTKANTDEPAPGKRIANLFGDLHGQP